MGTNAHRNFRKISQTIYILYKFTTHTTTNTKITVSLWSICKIANNKNPVSDVKTRRANRPPYSAYRARLTNAAPLHLNQCSPLSATRETANTHHPTLLDKKPTTPVVATSTVPKKRRSDFSRHVQIDCADNVRMPMWETN